MRNGNHNTEGDAMIAAGQTLTARSACDSDCIFKIEVISRSNKSAIVESSSDAPRRCKIYSDDKGEFIMPYDRYSMSPIFRA